MKHGEIISKMTLEEKAQLCDGKDFWHLHGFEKYGIPSILMTDGPHGIRNATVKPVGESNSSIGALSSAPATCFPPAVTTASSWDPALLFEMGEAIAEEALEQKVSVVLGPGVNIKRSPLCGRNFEYFSEDPQLAGEVAAGFINGVQSKGVGTSLKHFAANNQEKDRMSRDSVIDERALREIYLTAFELAVKKAQPWTVMHAYNKLNGTFCSENEWLLQKVLRDEWGFQGFVMSDWGANDERVPGLIAGQNLEMPSSKGLGSLDIVEAVKNGSLDEDILDKRVDELLGVIFKAKENLREYKCDMDKNHALARRIAGESMVLLKNEGNLLPLDKTKNYAIIGEMAKNPRYQGTGSSLINPARLDNAFDELCALGVKCSYSSGYDDKTDIITSRTIADAVKLAKSADAAVVFIGLTDMYEAEGFDRKHMNLPQNHNELITAVAEANENTIVVLSGGSPVTMPWLPKVKAVLNAYLTGQAGGGAVADILTGAVNPSGKLAETYPLSLEDTPCYKNYPGNRLSVEYRESVFVGYRYYDSAKKDVLFPFGFGLSYTEFKYSDIKLSSKSINDTDELTVSFKVKNTGKIAGAEVAQLYIKDTLSTIFRPEKELKGFCKIFLKPGQSVVAEIKLNKRAFAFYNTAINDWQVESGEFDILIGASSRDIRLEAKLNVTSTLENTAIPDYRKTAPAYYGGDTANIPALQFETLLGRNLPKAVNEPDDKLHLNSTLGDIFEKKRGKIVKRVYDAVLKRLPQNDPSINMVTIGFIEMPLRTFVHESGGLFSYDMANAVIDIFNGGKAMKAAPVIVKGLLEALPKAKNLAKDLL